jgi:hypothetical protein
MKRNAKSPPPPTKAIPITKGLGSTTEELQLRQDEAMADYRDLCMYVRIINGMVGMKGQSNVDTLNNIVRTRHLPVQDMSSSSDKEAFDKYTRISSLETTASWSVISPVELFSYAGNPKDAIPVIVTEPEDEGSREEETIFVLDL